MSVVVFYVLLTPIWLGLRAAAWVAELNSRRKTGIRSRGFGRAKTPKGGRSRGRGA
jgi:hypothetical protein